LNDISRGHDWNGETRSKLNAAVSEYGYGAFMFRFVGIMMQTLVQDWGSHQRLQPEEYGEEKERERPFDPGLLLYISGHGFQAALNKSGHRFFYKLY
jgi:hypothetical protein